MSEWSEWIVGHIDMQSFYASVEIAADPRWAERRQLEDDLTDPPLAVTGDPKRRSGIVLAASPTAKRAGVDTAMRLGEALQACPRLVTVRPRMQLYLDISVRVHDMVRMAFPLYEPFSVDECFFAFPWPSDLFPDPVAAARRLREQIWDQFRIRCRIGLAPNKWCAKMANKRAKKTPGGVVWWPRERVLAELHPLPVEEMWGLRRRAEVLKAQFGCRTIGDVARIPVGRLRDAFGVWGEVIHRWAHGMDPSGMHPGTMRVPHQGFSNRTTLPRDYVERADICVVVLELLDEVCERARQAGQAGRRIGLGLTYEGLTGGFYRAKTLPWPTNRPEELYPTLLALLDRHWDGRGVRAVSVSLDMLTWENSLQLSLFADVPRRTRYWRTVDEIRARFGETAVMRASSLLPAGQIRERARKIGGHWA
ncbi:DNA polymerase IV 2 [Alicyclobacillus cellulosilyticus]|uniref:DNA polymerase IV 2 n=1 Tax=Alicyclobacillus cellulosilyticus TaxID=1003997 RepID=A0A917K2D7_9BACL|nr:DNA polymerase IV [Alicyclobacillus cellulosilyticus]GGI98220.1 DNA polymerase IV 2 [Alicyclobacillus cellulosilyticus]